ncbi:hypothetical protein GMD78_09970 [Ornithinibacillus sp. L9]|uniref:Uncharacterized protein n=1 Tax=Ornithinibacillus caprae TaxID=2678566 RepID=A0A6N8FMZ3_9BACI|nr:hypothetical protein [Ornithinibacillus caprae]MUK88718.1 hypothetical protein [Ornithinibacillus caprae]
MKKLKVLTIGLGLVVTLALGFQPTIAEAHFNESHELEPISQLNENAPFAYPTVIGLEAPSSIYGSNASPQFKLNFSGDRGGGTYRWTFTPGNGDSTRSGSTSATSHSLNHNYYLGNRDSDSYEVRASVTGYSYDSTIKVVRHYR